MEADSLDRAVLLPTLAKALVWQGDRLHVLDDAGNGLELREPYLGELALVEDIAPVSEALTSPPLTLEVVSKFLDEQCNCYDALNFTIGALDSESDTETREAAAEAADELLSFDYTTRFVLNRLICRPPHERVDIAGALQLARTLQADRLHLTLTTYSWSFPLPREIETIWTKARHSKGMLDSRNILFA